jgi:NAD(P)-dependent dehydrogenase (short-subunit alcohol dehydrogenase family)
MVTDIKDDMNNEKPGQRSVVVTGVSTGIGRAIAEDLMSAGYRVFGSVRKREDAQGLLDTFGQRFVPLVFDVTDAKALPGVVAIVQQQLGGAPLAALVNNAGISLSGPLLLQPMAEFRQTFEVNLFAVLEVTRAFLPLLGTSGQTVGEPGRVVNIGSVSGTMTAPFMGAYSASKHALEALSQGLRRELMPYGIEVATIEPNFIRTDIFAKASAMVREQRYRRTPYESMWQQFNHSLLDNESKAKPPQLVTKAVLHAIAAKRPRTRYPLHPIWYVARLLPDRMFDKLILKALGLRMVLDVVR